jgi:LNR domain/Receptor L domain
MFVSLRQVLAPLFIALLLPLGGCESDDGGGGGFPSGWDNDSVEADTGYTAVCETPLDLGDGYCDVGSNTAACNWDGGDCCVETCRDADYACGEVPFDCKDPSVGGVVTPPDTDSDTVTPDGVVQACGSGVFDGDLSAYTPEDLQALAGMAEITGNLFISCQDCEVLEMLHCLTTIGGMLEIVGEGITSLNGLRELTSLGSRLSPSDYSFLSIARCPSLTSLTGLNKLHSIGGEGHLYIKENASLESLEGLEGIGATGSVDIHHNDALKTLDGLDSVTTVRGYLRIRSNPVLTSVTAMHTVESVGASLELFENDVLPNCAPIELRDAIGHENIGSMYPDGCCCPGGLCCPGVVEADGFCDGC